MECALCTKTKKKIMKKIKFSEIITDALAGSVSAVGSRIAVKKIMPGLNGAIKGGILMLIGAVGPQFIKGKTEASLMTRGSHAAGIGMISSGAIEIAESLFPTLMEASAPVVQGIGEQSYTIDEDYEDPGKVNGSPESVISGADDEDVMS